MPNPARHTILVVEDDPGERTVMELLLVFGGYAVTGTPDGGQALAYVADSPPDLIVLDITLTASMGGMEVLARLKAREQTAAIPVLMLTADPRESQQERALGLGAECYMTKPYAGAELIANVRRCMEPQSLSKVESL